MKYTKLNFIRAGFTSTLTEDRFNKLNKDNKIFKEQKNGKGLFADGITLTLFGFDNDKKAMFEITSENENFKECSMAYERFEKAFEKKFEETLRLDIFTQGFTKILIKE
ncbi:hypothetical protein DRO61_11660 [Candidatus Bathyarchaeota archaeon]|nr:MAG: hypothetical protein DRO61_11660 [Candidatus Bathyarchaeota archaeon]